MSKQKSAVEQFAEQLASKNLLGIYTYDEMVLFDDLLNQFKEVEKDRIMNAHGDEQSKLQDDGSWKKQTAEEYYNETYGGNK
jgi:hypothetical protein